MKFTDEQIKDIEDLSAINYSVRKIAMYLDIPAGKIYMEYNNPESEFRYHYDRGKLVAQALIDKANLESAKKGNISAIQQYRKKYNENKLQEAKERIFGRS